MSSLVFFCMVLHISTHSMCSLGVFFSTISLRFFIRAHVGDDLFGFLCFLVCFAVLIALCWIILVMFLFRLSMSSCSSSAVNLFFQFELNEQYGYADDIALLTAHQTWEKVEETKTCSLYPSI